MLAKHCLEEFKLDCQLRRLTPRTIKGYYNNTLNFLVYAEKHHDITEVEEIYTLHIKHYVQYLEILQKTVKKSIRLFCQLHYVHRPNTPQTKDTTNKVKNLSHTNYEI